MDPVGFRSDCDYNSVESQSLMATPLPAMISPNFDRIQIKFRSKFDRNFISVDLLKFIDLLNYNFASAIDTSRSDKNNNDDGNVRHIRGVQDNCLCIFILYSVHPLFWSNNNKFFLTKKNTFLFSSNNIN